MPFTELKEGPPLPSFRPGAGEVLLKGAVHPLLIKREEQ